jgi:hypothetical protein
MSLGVWRSEAHAADVAGAAEDAAARCINRGLRRLNLLRSLWKSLWRFGAVNRDMAGQPVHNRGDWPLCHFLTHGRHAVCFAETLHLGVEQHFNTTASVSTRRNVRLMDDVKTRIYSSGIRSWGARQRPKHGGRPSHLRLQPGPIKAAARIDLAARCDVFVTDHVAQSVASTKGLQQSGQSTVLNSAEDLALQAFQFDA